MSLIKNTKIEGDLSVGRNVAVGGEAVVNGKAKIKSGLTVQGRTVLQSRADVLDNLIVHGGLEVCKAKGFVCCKGYYSTLTALETAYGKPEKGWWAIVQGSATTLAEAQIYAYILAGSQSEWEDTKITLGSLSIEGGNIAEKVEQIVAQIAEINAKDETQDQDIATLKSETSSAQEELVRRNGLINVDALCGSCTASEFYTLEYAISAISNRQQATGNQYKKSGLIIVYRTGTATFETKIFKGDVGSFGNTDLWEDFGGKADEGKADEALQKALAAIAASSNAVVVANGANTTAKEAKSIANQASATATTAGATAETASKVASEAKEIADGMQGDVATVKKDIGSLQGAVSTNTASIISNSTQIKLQGAKISANADSISELQTKVATNTSDIADNTKQITEVGARVTATEGKIANNSTNISANAKAITLLGYKQPLTAFYEIIASVSDGTIDPPEPAISGGELVFFDDGFKQLVNKFYYRVIKEDGTILYYSKWGNVSGMPDYYELYTLPQHESSSGLRNGKLIYCEKDNTLYRITGNSLKLVSADLSKVEGEIATLQAKVNTNANNIEGNTSYIKSVETGGKAYMCVPFAEVVDGPITPEEQTVITDEKSGQVIWSTDNSEFLCRVTLDETRYYIAWIGLDGYPDYEYYGSDKLYVSGTKVYAKKGGQLTEVSPDLSKIEAEIATKANQADVDTLSTTVTNVQGELANHISEYTKSKSAMEAAIAKKANADDVYSKTETDTAMSAKANISDVYTKAEIDEKIGEINNALEEVLQ